MASCASAPCEPECGWKQSSGSERPLLHPRRVKIRSSADHIFSLGRAVAIPDNGDT
ncbi:hypothetical protein GWG65_08775 [Bradyrhizobium sp. CSA207]|nr:hypothetical protein [Bradyrhizobium sp. CSA207]